MHVVTIIYILINKQKKSSCIVLYIIIVQSRYILLLHIYNSDIIALLYAWLYLTSSQLVHISLTFPFRQYTTMKQIKLQSIMLLILAMELSQL